MYVADATPLIYLAKAQALDVFDSFDVVTTEGVYDEVVVAGKQADEPDARRVENYDLEVVEAPDNDLYDRLSESSGLSDVDAGVIALAGEMDGTALMDDRRGRQVADVEDINVRGTAYLLVSAVDRRDKSENEAKEVLDSMVDAGWYCSTSFYSKITAKLEDVA